MARANPKEDDESKKMTLESLLNFSKKYLAQGLLKYIKF